MRFRNRADAGRQLAERLSGYAGQSNVIVLALPRGGVPVGAEIASRLGAPLDVFLVRKVGVPGHAELAMGAIAEGGIKVRDDHLLRALSIPEAAFDQAADRERLELERRTSQYRGTQPAPETQGRTVILVDDGLATGSTMRAAVEAVRQHSPARVIVAVPVGAPSTCAEFADVTDETICARTPEPFSAVGLWYRDFSQTTDEDVHTLLDEHARSREGQQRDGDHAERRTHA